MTDLRTAAQQALEALEFDGFTPEDATHCHYTTRAITALRAALEQPELCSCGDRAKGKCPGEWEPGCDLGNNQAFARRVPLKQEPQCMAHGECFGGLCIYPSRSGREWRGLSEEEINDGLDQLPTEDLCNWSFRKGVYFAEAALRGKNHD